MLKNLGKKYNALFIYRTYVIQARHKVFFNQDREFLHDA